MPYKYPFGAVWLSHSSISDFNKCPHLYYFRNIYKQQPENRKIQLVNPYLTLGMVVHDTLESIRYLPQKTRFDKPLTDIFQELWVGFEGEKGGFTTPKEESEFKERGYSMIKRVQANPGPITSLSTIIKTKGDMVASFLLSETDNLVLCGNVDWVEVLPDGTLHIIDFKTGKNEEDAGSLQLQIYLLLALHGNRRPVTKTSYWYLDREDIPKEVPIPGLSGVVDSLIVIGQKIKLARQTDSTGGLACPQGGCKYCRDFDKVLSGSAKKVGYDSIREKILYFLPRD